MSVDVMLHGPRVLFFVEGNTDVRFVVGLSEISDLTLCVPATTYRESGLDARVAASGIRVTVHRIPGGRLAYQARSLAWLLAHVRDYDVVVSQELLRGSLNATIVGRLRGVPVITTMLLPPLEYFRCRRARGQMGILSGWAGEVVIHALMTISGRLTTRCVALGHYLQAIASRYCPRTVPGFYYGVDTAFFSPVAASERLALRAKHHFPPDAFVIFLASRISHEKDPETVLRATALARGQGLNAVVLNLSGGYQEFIALAAKLGLSDADRWVLGRPAAHPMTELADYFRLADAVAQGSLAEGLGLSPLEGLACGIPVVATRVGGMAATLAGFARLVPVGDAQAMAEEFLWIASHRDEARAQALRGREMVQRDWSRDKAFRELARVIDEVTDTEHRRAA